MVNLLARKDLFDEALACAQSHKTHTSVASRGRFAPSPTGDVHLGNVRTALLSWLHMRLLGGAFVVRMEDVDLGRVVNGSAQGILDDLRWLGLDWDEGPDVGGAHEPYTQSVRTDLYDEALSRLVARGLVYPCWCSRREVRQAAEAAGRVQGAAVVYPGTCRSLNDVQRKQRMSAHTPAYRFCVSDASIKFEDRLMGVTTQALHQEVGDFILKRSDGLYAYQFAVVVDDGLMAISDVLRGADLLDSTPRQIALFDALDMPYPTFWHVPLLKDNRGQKLSKRSGSGALKKRRAQGEIPQKVVAEIAHGLGFIDRCEPISARELLQHLELESFIQVLRRT